MCGHIHRHMYGHNDTNTNTNVHTQIRTQHKHKHMNTSAATTDRNPRAHTTTSSVLISGTCDPMSLSYIWHGNGKWDDIGGDVVTYADINVWGRRYIPRCKAEDPACRACSRMWLRISLPPSLYLDPSLTPFLDASGRVYISHCIQQCFMFIT